MKTRADVARKAGAPLAVATVALEGPRAGQVPVEIALARIGEDAPIDKVCDIGCGVLAF